MWNIFTFIVYFCVFKFIYIWTYHKNNSNKIHHIITQKPLPFFFFFSVYSYVLLRLQTIFVLFEIRKQLFFLSWHFILLAVAGNVKVHFMLLFHIILLVDIINLIFIGLPDLIRRVWWIFRYCFPYKLKRMISRYLSHFLKVYCRLFLLTFI